MGKPDVRNLRGGAGNVAYGGTVNPPRYRKGGAGNPPPTGARASALPDGGHLGGTPGGDTWGGHLGGTPGGTPRRPPNVTTARRSGEKTRHNRRDSLAFRWCIFVACYTTVETRMTRSDERRSKRARVRTRSTGCRQTARYVRPSAERRSVTPGRCARYGASWVTLTETETLGRSPQ